MAELEPPNNGDQPPRRPLIILTITLDPVTGKVEATGPIHDQVLCYGLLGRAHDAIKDYNDQVAKSGLVMLPAGSKLKAN